MGQRSGSRWRARGDATCFGPSWCPRARAWGLDVRSSRSTRQIPHGMPLEPLLELGASMHNAVSRLTDQPALDAVAKPLSTAIKDAYEAAGPAGHLAKNAVHGVWLGHPLHPVFT